MPYCIPQDVKDLVNTDLQDQQLARLIQRADAELDDRLQGESMTQFNKKECSARLAAIMIAQNQRSIFKNTGETQFYVNSGNIREWNSYVNQKIAQAFGRWDSTDGVHEGKVFVRRTLQ